MHITGCENSVSLQFSMSMVGCYSTDAKKPSIRLSHHQHIM